MPYSIAIGSISIVPASSQPQSLVCTCQQAQKACMPSFVFSISGQVRFREALAHLTTCNSRQCMSLRKKVKEGMYQKLDWLFKEDVLLGCLQLQPFIYKTKRPVNVRRQQHFRVVAHHLAQCPHESCARLRRSLLLTVRDHVSPNARQKAELEDGLT